MDDESFLYVFMVPSFPVANSKSAAANGLVQKFGFIVVLAFVYFYQSRFLEVTRLYDLHLPLILGIIAVGCALLSGRIHQPFSNKVGVLHLALTAWFILSIPFAFWRGGSTAMFKGWLRTLLIWAAMVALTVTYRECKALLNTMVFAAATAAAFGFNGADQEARLGLEIGLFSNPNYYALSLLLALPFAGRFYSSGPGILRRVAAAAIAVLLMVSIFRTGSRMALFAICTMLILVFIRAELLRKIQIAAAILLGLGALWATLPGHLRDRYVTLFSKEDQYESQMEKALAESAVASTESRQHLLEQSVKLSARNPFFGVGIGNFAPYIFRLNRDLGRPKEPYLGTHNTYTQISSEAGIPALFIFLAICAVTWRSLGKLIRAAAGDAREEVKGIQGMAQSAQTALAGLLLSLFFIHMAYDFFPYMVLGAAHLVGVAGERELASLRMTEAPPPPAAHEIFRPAIRVPSARAMHG